MRACLNFVHIRSLKRTLEEAAKVSYSKETKPRTASKIVQKYAPKVAPAVTDAQQAASTEITFARIPS